ncbi:MAG: succinate dehydrogenase assembly factor 2 [Methyloligellaceae bacterium]
MSAENDETEIRKRRAIYRANHRGTKEMDLIVGKYSTELIPGMSEDELTEIEEFLGLPDRDLEAWIMRKEFEADNDYTDLIAKIREFHGLVN